MGSHRVIEPHTIDDDALLLSIRQGDQTAWSELYNQHAERVERLIARVGRLGPAEVDDLAQETWARAFEKRTSCKVAVKPWLLRIASNVTIDAMRRNQRWRMASIEKEPRFGDELVDRSSKGRFAQALEARELLSAAFDRMPPDQVAILYLVLEEQMSLKEAAAALGVSSTTAAMSQRLKRAIAAFHRALQEDAKSEK